MIPIRYVDILTASGKTADEAAAIEEEIENIARAESLLATRIANGRRWDEEIERDFSPGGAGMELLGQVKQRISLGLSRPFSDGRPLR